MVTLTPAEGEFTVEAARLARTCPTLRRALALAQWIGAGPRNVTPGQVLTRPDVPAAGAAISVRLPSKVRTAADLPELHAAWSAALGAGLLRIEGKKVSAVPGDWTGDEAVLGAWLAALRAVCGAMADPRYVGVAASTPVITLAALSVLRREETLAGQSLRRAVVREADDLCDAYGLDDKLSYRLRDAATSGESPGAWMIDLLAGLGAVKGIAGRPVITSLGRWAAVRLAQVLDTAAAADIDAAELIMQAADVDDAEERWRMASRWLAKRGPREILAAAESMSPSQRVVAVELAGAMGQQSIPAWREFAASPTVGPHAHGALYTWDDGSYPDDADLIWLAVEFATVALHRTGPDEALSVIWDRIGSGDLDDRLAAVRESRHPQASELAIAVAEFAASGASRSIDQGIELKVTLKRSSPAIWRSVRLPLLATLGDLHQVIQLLFGWDGDHMHVFRVARRVFSEPWYNLEDAADEGRRFLRDVFGTGVKVEYEYDLGASWEHMIARQRSFQLSPGLQYPVCVAFGGDSPVEYPDYDDDDEEGSAESEPFDIPAVNHQLAELGARHG
jgi:Plasmid pRiA4b ORF-3-like protein